MKPHRGPVVVELGVDAAPNPGLAPVVPDVDAPDGRAMQTAVRLGGAGGLRLGGWFLASMGSLIAYLAGLAAWNYVAALLARHPILGWIAASLFGVFLLTALLLALKELGAYARLGRLDRIRHAAEGALAAEDMKGARATGAALARLYQGRPDLAWGAQRYQERAQAVMDAGALLALAEAEFLANLDQAARREIESAARQVATVTALVPLALADVAAALFANLRMLRRIAQVYGGRAGTFGSLRLMRQVMIHLVATGAVAVGDDLIHSVAGGGLLSKLSRRFGEGVINGALTARVGLAAMEVCRPLPFIALPRPKVTNLVTRGLRGLFGTGGAQREPGTGNS